MLYRSLLFVFRFLQGVGMGAKSSVFVTALPETSYVTETH
jgi:hypothetical protein